METNDIQGNVVAGFNTRFEALVALAFRPDADPASAARWIGSLSPRVATVDDVRSSREAMKDPANDMPPWLAVAISKRVIDAVLPQVLLNDINFNAGMAVRKTAIGDETRPADWVVGGPNHVVDLLLTIAANDPLAVESAADDLVREAAAAGLEMTYRETGTRLPGEIEHFGFKDGVSQPEIAGDRSPAGIQPGHFVFGYPDFAGGPPVGNQQDPPGFSRNGSLLVFRRLRQEVAEFHAFFDSESTRLAPQWPGLTASHLAALIVGRWPSGAPVSVTIPNDPGAGEDDNAFDFRDDLEATRCPFGAHIRKVNPREGNRDLVDVPRILRRGIPFGPLYAAGGAAADRGLLFVAYQTSLKDQFVFLSGSWMNRGDLPQAGGGFDVLVGRASSPRSLPIKGPQGEVNVVFNQSHWIKPTGGAYLFAPGRNGLAMLAQPPSLHLAAARALSGGPEAESPAEEFREIPAQRDGSLTTVRAGTSQWAERAEWPLTRLTAEGAAALPALRHLRHLDLAGKHFPTQILGAEGIRELAASPGLEQLSVHAAAVPGSVLRTALARLPLVSHLDLRGADVTDDDIAGILQAQPALAGLSLGKTTEDRGPHHFHSGRLTAGIIQQLGQLRNLRSLSIRGLPVDDASLAAIGGLLGALEEFDGGETRITDATLAKLAPPASLRRLRLDRTDVTDEGIAPFAESPDLRDLDVSATLVTGSIIDSLLARKSLVRLAAAGLRISDNALPNLAGAESLTDLDLSNTRIGDRTAAAIARLPLLENLSISSTSVTSRGLAALAASSLLALDAERIGMDADALAAVCRMRRLRSLKLTVAGTDWTPLSAFEGRLSLTAPPHDGPMPRGLENLSLTGEMQSGLCGHLSRLPNLASLSLRGGAEHFPAMMDGGFPRLRSVVAEQAGLDDTGLDLLGRVPNLEELFISGNSLSASVVRLSAPYLHTLELRDTDVDDRAIEALARLPRLHCLDLPGTRVTAGGIAALVPAARNLQSLALDGHQLTPAVARVLADSSTLIEIYLYGPAVTDTVLAHLAPLFQLRELNLSETAITESSAPTLIALNGLRTLRIFGTSHSRAFVARLRSSRPDIQLMVNIDPSISEGRSHRANFESYSRGNRNT